MGDLAYWCWFAGNTLHLPIAGAGGLFSRGDGHALQGDGEVSGTARECPLERVEVRFEFHDDLALRMPWAESPGGLGLLQASPGS